MGRVCEVGRLETRERNHELCALNIVPIYSDKVGHTSLCEGHQPRTNAAANIEDGLRVHKVHHERHHGTGRPQ
jgi:hypothetical protein